MRACWPVVTTQSPGQAQIRAPAAAPAPAPTPSYASEPLPLPASSAAATDKNLERQPAIDVFIAGVQAVYDAGQNEAQAGHRDKAQAKFDLAADMILKSGFSADFNDALSKLSDEIGEASQPGELNLATNNADEEQDEGEESETPAEPAPIDEIADLTLPAGDPRLALKAEKELIGVRHDLPLTVNDSVLQYLSFFTTTRGRAIVEHGLDRAGRYDGMIRRVLKEEGVPQDLIYLAQAESAFQPQAVSAPALAASGSSCLTAAKNTISSELTGLTTAATRKKRRARRPTICAISTPCSLIGIW